MGLREKMKEVILGGGYVLFEAYMACIMFLSSLVILNPYTDIFSNGKAYSFVSRIISEDLLGSILLFSALFSLLALYSFDLQLRKWAMLLQTWIWGLLFVGLVAPSSGVWFPMLLAFNCIFCGIVFARMYKDHG